jgi:hypothetical protein
MRILAIVAVVTPAAAHAQHRGTIELGGFARYGVYDNALNLDDAAGYGARLGYFLSGKVILEADAALAPQSPAAPTSTTNRSTFGSSAICRSASDWPFSSVAVGRTTPSATRRARRRTVSARSPACG